MNMNISDFMRHLENRGCSKETQRAYRQDLQRFEKFLQERGLNVEEINLRTADEFSEYLSINAGRIVGSQLAPASIARRLASVSSYLNFHSAQSDGSFRNIFAKVKRPKIDNNLPRAVAEDVLLKLLAGITNSRDRAIMVLFVYSGLRLKELAQLDKDTIQIRKKTPSQGPATVIGEGEVIGKGNKRRAFLADIEAMKTVAKYLVSRVGDKNPALFISSRGTRLSCRAIQHNLHKWCDKLEIPRLHIHQLRHSFATSMVNAGMSSPVLQQLMGHRSLETTQRYFRIRPERMTREYFAAREFIKIRSPV